MSESQFESGQHAVNRVLHLRDTDRICGPGKTILETANRIDRLKYEIGVGVFVRSMTEENDYITALRSAGVRAEPILMTGLFDRSVIGRISDLIRRDNYRIVHTHEYKGDLIAWGVSRNVNVHVLSTCHGWIKNNFKAKVFAYLQKKALRKFRKVIAVSPLIRTELIESGLKKEQVDVIFNAIVSEDYSRKDVDGGFVREHFGLAENAVIIGCIGRLSPEKGQRDLLRAAPEVLKAHENVYVLFVGDGPDLGHLRQMTADLGISDKVLFMGHTRGIKAVYRDLDGLVLPSHTEGFPNVILEALCMEVPVIATNVGGVPDIIINKETGRLVEPGCIGEFVNALDWMLSRRNDALQSALRGRRRVLDLYEFENRCRKLEAIYDVVLATHN